MSSTSDRQTGTLTARMAEHQPRSLPVGTSVREKIHYERRQTGICAEFMIVRRAGRLVIDHCSGPA